MRSGYRFGVPGLPAKGPLIRIAALLLALLLAACDQQQSVYQSRQFVFGTLVDIRIHGSDVTTAETAAMQVMSEFDRLHADWHAWDEGSALNRVNAALARQHTAALSGELAELVRRSLALARASNGLFDPTIARLSALWGFHSDTPEEERRPPATEQLAAWRADPPSWRHLRLDDGTLRSEHPGVRLDVGAYAKGIALEHALDILEQAGVRNALVNAGGDLAVLGSHGNRAWRLGIRAPQGGTVLASLDVHDGEALVTSGDYERGFHHDGIYYHHLLDPRNGLPARGTRSVTVLHDDAGVADAAATALFVAGPGAWPPLAASLGLTHIMLVADNGSVEMTPAMQERIRFEDGHEPSVTVIAQP